MEAINASPRKRDPEMTRALAFVWVFLVCLVWGSCVCGCHFRPMAAPAGLIPLPFSLYLLRSYQSFGGRVFAWVAFLLACGVFAMDFSSNLKFALF